MRLFIAEKPSLGRAIADVLPKPHKKGDGYITAANGDTVSWCIGHLLEQQQPEAYDPAFKKWNHEHLPIIPQQWQLAVKKNTAKQLGVLRTLVKQAEQLIHAGDPDREGQLLVDEVINFLGVTGAKKDSIQRCLINDLNPSAVKQSLSKLRSNREFIPLSTSALARSRADWLYGINLTRAYTLQGQKVGYKGVLSVGRVQTPLLGLVVRRDNAIEAFVSKAFYEVWACLETEKGEHFKAKWQPSEQCAKYLDEQGRNLSQALAQNVAGRISQQPAQVKKLKREHKKPAPPLPYNLSSLQIDASKAFGLSAQQVLDICQGLYERHKLITYPRSDCRYLPLSHFVEAKDVHAAILSNSQHLGQQGSLFSQTQFDLKRKSKAWNDKKVDAHHAIIPTKKTSNHLSGNDAKVYALICRNYLAQFLGEHQYHAVRVEVEIALGLFVAVAKELIEDGWRSIFIQRSKSHNQDNNNETEQLLPRLNLGQHLKSLQAEVLEKHTSPPKAYTDASLLAAMTGISAHVSDPQLRKILRDTDGLGTEATRAGIIELLFSRGFLSRTGKTITSTSSGRGLIEALPDVATYPDMTARWESELSAISEGRSQYKKLMSPLQEQLKELVVQSREVLPKGLSGLGKPRFAKKRRASTKRK
ncbi:DNA topoisomerase III [Paraglaciecola psychrophila]|uniref:DNA topoisomerase n=1 Tax=Paraglaciecola psychrophila 170 TaxID=1129794 RepID=K7ANV4_9ALTE|nr:DNA topoisomerase III [Paraglaciecola psychrophila]AGH43284.1 DNA topoisomerase III [Paraglaciecola psychrophila 170]GAC37010.1 DNA topoisomerase III [Paraglaciecola psychrophila 170]